jgi:hypothetical protein
MCPRRFALPQYTLRKRVRVNVISHNFVGHICRRVLKSRKGVVG